MRKGISICLTGPDAEDVAKVLAGRLLEMGRSVERIDAQALDRLGGRAAAAFACHLLARNGVLVIITCPEVQAEGERIEAAVDVHDTPDFAAEKVLDALAERGVVNLASVEYTAEEEEQIRRRLADLGYIE